MLGLVGGEQRAEEPVVALGVEPELAHLVRTVEPVDRVGGLLKVAGPGKPGLLADAEPEDSDAVRPRAADRFKVYPGEAWGGEADAVAE